MRESVNDMLQESFRSGDLERGEAQAVTTVDLSLADDETLALLAVEHPEPEELRFEAIDETLSAYVDSLVIEAHCRGVSRDEGWRRVGLRLRYQACNERVCYPPRTLDIDLPIQILPHDWERLE